MFCLHSSGALSLGSSRRGAQVRITQHAARLLVPGGRLVYSTCSLNPVEDEAVVTEVLPAHAHLLACCRSQPACGPLLMIKNALQVLREAEGALELVDVAGSLPALQRVPGLRTWGVQAKEGFFGAWDAAQAVRARLLLAPIAYERQPAHRTSRQSLIRTRMQGGATRLLRSMFPPDSAPPLERCLRVLPHHGDTGAFFIAVMRKTRELPAPAPAPCARLPERAVGAVFQWLVTLSTSYRCYSLTATGCVATRRAASAAEKGSEPAFSVPAARQAPPPAEALAAAAGLPPAAEASGQSPGPVPAAADAGIAVGAAAAPPPAAGQGGADPVGDVAYEEVVGLAEDAADAAKVFAQAIRQQVRSAWHLLQGLACVFSCEPCDPAALPPLQDIAVATEAAADSAASVEAVAALVGDTDAPAESESASTAGPAASAAPGPVRCCFAPLPSRGACSAAVGLHLFIEQI